ncbi:hypothetical protein BaRGS_00011444 [Batillaria attramentaria]|uniref:Uncharacterized protein n=1 Tax=Batillaria attramentaria TaxID=370345 RepID=A0ABD0LDE4_9CAEN
MCLGGRGLSPQQKKANRLGYINPCLTQTMEALFSQQNHSFHVHTVRNAYAWHFLRQKGDCDSVTREDDKKLWPVKTFLSR